MRRLVVLFFLMLCAVAVALRAQPAAAQPRPPTQAELAAAILTTAEINSVDDGFTQAQRGPQPGRNVNFSVSFERTNLKGYESVGILLRPSADATPDEVAQGAVDGIVAQIEAQNLDSEVLWIAAPVVGRDTVRAIMIVKASDGYVFTDLIAWRQGAVTAMVIRSNGNHMESAFFVADRQQEKLASVFR